MATCPETKVFLPKNDSYTCWWLSANFALFHKQRKELDDFLKADKAFIERVLKESAPDKKTSYEKVVKSLQDTIRYFQGQGEQSEKAANAIIAMRKSAEMKDVFDTADFKVDSTQYQDAGEYIAKIGRFLSIPRYTAKGIDSDCFDAYLQGHFFPEYLISDNTLQTQIYRIHPKCETFILEVYRHTTP